MASTFSPNLRLELIGTGDQQGTWGATTNTNLGTLLEDAIGGFTTVSVADAGDTTLTVSNGAADQSRNMVINLTGALTGTRNVICPAVEKLYVVKNATTGDQSVVFKVSGQTGVSIPNGGTVFLYVDGTDARQITGSAAAYSVGTSGNTIPVLNTINTFVSGQKFGNGTGFAGIYVDGGAGSSRDISFRTGTGANSPRFSTGITAAAETGSNIGSDYAVARFSDSGSYIDIPFTIARSTGVTTIKELDLTADLGVLHGGTGASNAAAARTNLGLGTASTYNVGTSGNTVPVLSGTNTWSGSQTFTNTLYTFGSDSANISVELNGVSGTNRVHVFRSAGVNRWITGANNNAESGGNAGSNYVILSYNDAGGFIESPLSIARSTGVTSIKELNLTNDLAIGNGGTGASSALDARTNLGLAIGTNVQAYDATLQSLSALGTAADRMAYTTGVDTWAETAITAAGRAILDDADATAQRTTLGAAALASPTFTGTPAAPTAAAYTNTTQIATTAQVYSTVTNVPENAQTSTTYTLVAADKGKMVTLNNASAITLTVPNSVFTANDRVDLLQYGAGQVTVQAGSGVTLRAAGSRVKLFGQYSGATLWFKSASECVLIGDLV